MGDAFAWLGQLFEWLGKWIPRWVILDTTDGAIKYVKGVPKLCEAGRIHWYWPVTTTWAPYPVARQTDRLESQVMETSDGVTFIASGTITYEVVDLMQLIPTTHSPMTTVIDIAMTAVHDVCCDLSWDMLRAEQRHFSKLKTKLRTAAQDQLKDYGIRVIKLQLNTLAKCRVLKVSQSVAQEEN